MNFIKYFAGIVLLLIIVFAVLILINSSPLTTDQAVNKIEQIMENSLNSEKSVYSAFLYVDAPRKNINIKYAAGTNQGESVDTGTPFHVASVGKLFTATLIGKLIDEGLLNLNDPIKYYLDEKFLEGLFVYENVDHKDQVTVQQLLSHTSGIADYFAKEDNGLIESIYESPDAFFTPQSLVQYTRENQSAYFASGDGYHYSDTGYVLLGLIIESVTGRGFDEMLHEIIFDPLGMQDTYLMFYSEPANEKRRIAEIWVDGHEVSDFASVSIDWAGGGVVSTLDDLSVFIRALYAGEIISSKTLHSLEQYDQEFMRGISYGNGFMRMEFTKFSPTLGFLAQMRGHMGVLGTQLFYDKETDLVYVTSFGSTDYTAKSVRIMIQILSVLYRVK